MTLRTDEETDAALARLARRWGVSKQAAALRAIALADERSDQDALLALGRRVLTEDAGLLDRLGDA